MSVAISRESKVKAAAMNSLCKGLNLLLKPQNYRPLVSKLHDRTSLKWAANNVSLMQPFTAPALTRSLHLSSAHEAKLIPNEPKNWPKYNEILYPPTPEGEPVRPAEIVHHWANVKYKQKKLWYICHMIRGMSVDEAKKQLSFIKRNGGAILKEMIEEAQEMAVKEHNVEFKSNLWISDAFTTKAKSIKGIKKGGRGRYNTLVFRYCHIMLRLREGRPPKHYYAPDKKTGHQLMEDYIQRMRDRKIQKML